MNHIFIFQKSLRLWERERNTFGCVAGSLRPGFWRAMRRCRCVQPWMVRDSASSFEAQAVSPSLRLHLRLCAVPSSWLRGSGPCYGLWAMGDWVVTWCLSNGKAADLASDCWRWLGNWDYFWIVNLGLGIFIFVLLVTIACLFVFCRLYVLCCLFVFVFFIFLFLV